MPTETPIPLPTTSPYPGVDFYHDLQANAVLTAGAVWAVLFLIVFVTLTRPKQRTLLVLSLLILISLPLAILNSAVWAITVYLFVLFFQIINTLFHLID